MLKRIVCGFLVLSSAMAGAESIDFNLSDNSLEFRYILETGTNMGGTEIDAGMLYTDSSDLVGMLGMQVTGETGSGSPGISAGVGFKLFGVTTGQTEALSVAVGGQLDYTPATLPRLGLLLRSYFAPDIVSFLDAENLFYLMATLEYEVLSEASVYLGHRTLRLRPISSPNNLIVEEGLNIGIRMYF